LVRFSGWLVGAWNLAEQFFKIDYFPVQLFYVGATFLLPNRRFLALGKTRIRHPELCRITAVFRETQ
jgi:hypothetical protein